MVLGAALLGAAACGGGSSGPATGTVQGVVRDTASAPLEQVTVQLRNAATTTVVRSVATTASGAYTMLGIASGSYDLFIMEPPAMQVVGTNPAPASVTGGGSTPADFSLRYLPVSFSSHVGPLLNASCAAGSCHGGATPQKGMNLATGQAYANIVNAQAVEPTSAMDRIEPSDTALSYLIHKLQNTQGSLCSVPADCGTRMPQGAPALPLQTIRMIKRWVMAGALNN